MPEINVRVELDAHIPIAPDDLDALVDPLMDLLEDFDGTVARSLTGRPELIFTVQADTVWQATTLARALIGSSGHDVLVLEVMGQDEFVRRSEDITLPSLVSVAQAAELLGVTRQSVLERVQRGTLPAVKVGDTWILPRQSVVPAGVREDTGAVEVMSYP